MAYVIAAGCIDTTDKSCVDACPVDCIYEGDRKLYINPVECIDCGACAPVCPVEAITQDRRVPEDQLDFVADNAQFFSQTLPGRSEPLGEVGGASTIGRIGVDTEFVTKYADSR